MSLEYPGLEYEFEPQHGLPERLPADEVLIWQGSPDARMLALSAFHVRKVAIYFAALTLLTAWPVWQAQAAWAQVWASVQWLVLAAAVVVLSLWGLAQLSAKSTVYTVTSKRVVMRLGVVLTVSFNLPFKQIASADMRLLGRGVGDITLALHGRDRIAWIHLWPSVRAWRLHRPEPTLRAVPHAAEVAEKLRAAWMQHKVTQSEPAAHAPERPDWQVSMT